jgi:transcription-repair coupling factor (superfamily II helicase)
MSLSALIRTLISSQLTHELVGKLQQHKYLHLNGAARLPRGLVASALAQVSQQHLWVITSTIEEASRWTAQLEAMNWSQVYFYPVAESADLVHPEAETVWGQMQTLTALSIADQPVAIVSTVRALASHLPDPHQFQNTALELRLKKEFEVETISAQLAIMGYERVSLVETEGQWSRRGDIIDIFPVAAELPVRLEWFGDELEKMREFDPSSQRSLDAIDHLLLTPTGWGAFESTELGCSLADYLPANTLMAVDDLERCLAHSVTYQFPLLESIEALRAKFQYLRLSEIAVEGEGLNLSSRPVPALPHQFAKLAEILRQHQQQYSTWIVSAQPSRSAALLQEHDCLTQFVPNPRDFGATDKLQTQHVTVAVKYSGMAELEGFLLPTFRVLLLTDREFFGQQSLVSYNYVRKRRQAASKKVDPNKMQAGDFVIHRHYGLGRFMGLENVSIDNDSRDYLTIKYADGILRVAADQLGVLSRFRHTDQKLPELNKMSGQAWAKTKAKVQKSIKKLAFDLLKLYAERSDSRGFAYPIDSPWQQELEDSFRYQPTPDQLKAVQDVKRDMESDRPMDRLICGDVGFGKTEVAIRAIFKAVTTAQKQVILLAPTTILTQQHYHTLKERFAPYPVNVGLLNRFRTAEERKDILKRLATGELDVVVGTHQVLSKDIKPRNLGLLVVDEEQRFGVNQKEKIKTIKSQVDVLTLSATPIPRTLYMSLSGVREMSLITTPPPSRRPIQTHLSPYQTEAIGTAIRQELERGGQVFYVVPKVMGIEDTADKLRELVPSCRIAIAHGQMDESQLEATMLAFSSGEADLLLCTTIVESGLDIPRVNTILIEDAQRFGLSQLYQLRGRVGRAGIQAHAWLFYPKEQSLTDQARQRLRAIQEFAQLGSGYQLATRDMEIRGVGNLLGAEQSGQMEVIGFDLYMEMLQTTIQEIRGQEIPQVDDTQIDLAVTALIPADYIPDLDQKISAYRSVAAASSHEELVGIAAEWIDRYGEIPKAAQQLFRIMELKQVAKQLGFSRIKPDGKQHVVLETPMAEPAWNLLAGNLPDNMKSRFVYGPGKVTVRGLGVFRATEQVESLIGTLGKLQAGLTGVG